MNFIPNLPSFGRSIFLLLAIGMVSDLPSSAQNTIPTGLSLDSWKSALPFSFKYDGKDSSSFLSTWPRTEETATSPGGQMHRYIFIDPATKLKVVAEVRTFTDFDAIDWVLKFSNGGDKDTPILENIDPLNWSVPEKGDSILHHALGSRATVEDFGPLTEDIHRGQSFHLANTGGRSSQGALPFFNLQNGNHGLLGAIGWSGDWMADFVTDKAGETVALTAGMQHIHLLLHPGEEIRTPRIVLLNWKGNNNDWQVGQNLWRHFVLAWYTPQENGAPIVGPISYGTWGADTIANKLAQIKLVRDNHLPFDVYWVDAGWHGNSEGSSEHDGPNCWWRNRGSWWANKANYPDGLKPLSDAVHAANMRFLVWFEPEEGDPNTTLRNDHPDWFFMPATFSNPGTAVLNLGKPEARQGVTDLISKVIADNGIDWYRQDFNVNPDKPWATADTPDRVGMSEIQDVEGLYAFWDDLRAKHPGLLIDNCASGGQRLDIETLSRSVPLWRCDQEGWPLTSQVHTQGLSDWVPINGGAPWLPPGPFSTLVAPTDPFDHTLIYRMRSGYSSAMVVPVGVAENKTPEWCAGLKATLDEYREIRPFFQGDYYPLIPYSLDKGDWAAWQFDRPDQKAGVVIVLRRADSNYGGIDLGLHALDPNAKYQVEIRTGLEKAPSKTMSGEELAHLSISLTDKPGSALVLYQQQ